jgi:hypothetical protein
MRLRQVALVAASLAEPRQQFFQLLGLNADFADRGVAEFGLENSVMAIGDTYLEIVAPTQPGTTAERLLKRRGGDGGYMVICQVDDIALYRSHTEALKVRKVWDADLPDAKAFHMHPRDIGGAIVSLDEMTPPESWRWAGPGWQDRQATNVRQIIGVSVQAEDPDKMAARWAEIFMLKAGGRNLNMADGSWVEFTGLQDERGEGVTSVTFAGAKLADLESRAAALGLNWGDQQVELGGVQLRFTE